MVPTSLAKLEFLLRPSVSRIVHISKRKARHQLYVSFQRVEPTTRRLLRPFSSWSSPGDASSDERPFTILGLQQIAIGSTDPKQMSHLWQNVFGLPKIGTHVSKSENVSEDILQLGPSTRQISIPIGDILDENSGGDWMSSGASEDTTEREEENVESLIAQATIDVPFVEVDLMCPIDATKSPKVHIPPLNHIGLWVDDLESSVQWMKDNGVRFAPGGIRKGAAGHDVAFIHPKGNDEFPVGGGGVLIELVQAPPDVIKALKPEDDLEHDDDEDETATVK